MKKRDIVRCTLLFTIIVLTVISVLSFSSCDREYDEQAVLTETERLLKQAEVLNEVYWGGGIDYMSGGFSDGIYKQASDTHLRALGFSTVAELRALTESTYSASYVNTIYTTKLDDAPVGFVLYIQKWEDEINKKDPVCIMVNSQMVRQSDTVEYDYSSLKVNGADGDIVNVSVEATVTNSDGNSQRVTLNIQLIEELGGWRINNPTHAMYYEENSEQ